MLDKIFNYLNFHFSVEASIVLLILVFLEAVLSADNAIALAAIAQGLEDKKTRRSSTQYWPSICLYFKNYSTVNSNLGTKILAI